MAENPDISLLLEGLKEHNNKDLEKVALISSSEDVMLRPLTVGQQKKLVGTLISQSTSELTFDATLGEIILENNTTKQEIYSIDIPFVLLQLRVNLMGKSITLTLEDQEYDINIYKHIGKMKKTFATGVKTGYTLSEGDIHLQCSSPTLSRECKISREATEYVNSKHDSMIDAAGDVYLIEVLKQIVSVTVGDNKIDMNDLDIESAVSLVSNIPYSLTKKIITKTGEFSSIIDKISTPDGLPDGVPMDIDGRLFTGE